MNPKSYFENYLIDKRDSKIFVCRPFLNKCKKRVEDIIRPTAKDLDWEVEDSDDSKVCVEITERINDGINTAKILLFDLSGDTRYGNNSNPNVMYELGIARTTREDEDIIIITDFIKIDNRIPSDIKNAYIIENFSSISKKDFKNKLNSVIINQDSLRDKRIDRIISLFDKTCLEFILCFGLNPKDDISDHFCDGNVITSIQKLAILRLLDLKIIYTAMDHAQISYHFTEFGRTVIKKTANKLGVKRKEGMICNHILECKETLERF